MPSENVWEAHTMHGTPLRKIYACLQRAISESGTFGKVSWLITSTKGQVHKGDLLHEILYQHNTFNIH